MHKHLVIAQDIFIDHATQVSSLLGLSDGMARILALLYMSPEPVSIPSICERLALTKGTVSLHLRMLEERRIIVRAWSRKQGKQKFYEINPGLWSDILDDFRTKAQRRIEITERALAKSLESIRKGEREYRGEDRIVSKLFFERLERLREINQLSRSLLDRFLVSRSASKKGAAVLERIRFSEE